MADMKQFHLGLNLAGSVTVGDLISRGLPSIRQKGATDAEIAAGALSLEDGFLRINFEVANPKTDAPDFTD